MKTHTEGTVQNNKLNHIEFKRGRGVRQQNLSLILNELSRIANEEGYIYKNQLGEPELKKIRQYLEELKNLNCIELAYDVTRKGETLYIKILKNELPQVVDENADTTNQTNEKTNEKISCEQQSKIPKLFIFVDGPNTTYDWELMPPNGTQPTRRRYLPHEHLNWPAIIGLSSGGLKRFQLQKAVWYNSERVPDFVKKQLSEAENFGFSLKWTRSRKRNEDPSILVDMMDIYHELNALDNVVIALWSGDGHFAEALERIKERGKNRGIKIAVRVFAWSGRMSKNLLDVADDYMMVENVLKFLNYYGYIQYTKDVVDRGRLKGIEKEFTTSE